MEKVLKQYVLRIQGLADKEHEFEFKIGSAFFKAFEQDLVDNGQFDVLVKLIKSSSVLQVTFYIKGSVKLVCDRSLEEFDYPIEVEEPYLYKFGDKYEVMSDEVEVVPFGISEINIAQHLFDFIALAIPMKRLHPRCETDFEEEKFEEKEPGFKDKKEKDHAIDPRWAALLTLNKTKK